jgi:hypothetical protein
METRTDYFGNAVTTIAVFGTHEKFIVTSTSVVETGIGPVRELPVVAWETVRDQLAEPTENESLAASEFIFESPYVPVVKQVAEYARTTFTPGRPLVESVRELKHRIHEEFIYLPESTSIEVPLQELMEKRHGVCQDFAHVMIGALRSVGSSRTLCERLPAQWRGCAGRGSVACLGVSLGARRWLGRFRSDQRCNADRWACNGGLGSRFRRRHAGERCRARRRWTDGGS